MKREDIVKAFEMRLDGMTLQAIGDHFGVSRERIRQLLDGNCQGARRFPNCIYPGLEKWMKETRTHGYSFYKMLDLWDYPAPTLLYARLSGKTNFTVPEIKRVLAVTGMTFEEAFGEVE